MNEIPSICMLLAFAPNLTDLVSSPSYDRAYVMPVNIDNTVTDLPAFEEFLFLYKNLSDYGLTIIFAFPLFKVSIP